MNRTTTTMRTLGILTFAASVMGAGLITSAAARDMKDVPLTLTGCVIPGEAKNSFLVTNVTVSGTTLAPADAYYRLDSTEKLKNHVGHRVEIMGEADLVDHDKGKLEVTAKDGKVETKVTSERQTVKTNTPVWGGTTGAMTTKSEINTYGFEVKSVKRLAGNCANAAAAMQR